MIPLITAIWQTESWQRQMQQMIRDPEQLFSRLGLDIADRPDLAAALAQFPLRVTEAFIAKMQTGDWNDPLLLQVLPQAQEMTPQAGFVDDPLAELDANPVPGLIHKYHGRVLLITSPACAIHCRYCFRRNFPYSANNPSQRDWQQALDYIAAHPEINEVILSGGDPLAASDDYLHKLISRIASIPHVDTLRLHTRLPLVLPARITPELIATLSRHRLRTVMVIHCNHANEIDNATRNALSALQKAGITLLNQSVLLKGINDNVDTLITLSRRLFEVGVMPYYLHVLDKVRGASHFDVSEHQAQTLMRGVLAGLPGYLVPRLVREDPHASSKRPLALL
ncbi:EF-P beta-lysylation protein EpmB [Zhongshania guokunii]|uniref:L-lysine 2,3-aminomutase n=1 Tax=Zhongshania guokunii TaxID=641783 RepID=A0ABV3UAC2_9GAMM